MFYQNCKFHDPMGGGLGIRVGPKWSVMKCVNTIKHFLTFQIWHEASLGQGAHKL